MTTSGDPSGPLAHAPSEHCATCAAPLAGDQRYCLECGARRGAARLDPLACARGDSGSGDVPEPAESVPAWVALPPAALALGRPRVAALAAAGVLAFGALLGASVVPGPGSAAAGRVYVAGSMTGATPSAATPPTDSAAEGGGASDADVGDGSSDLASADVADPSPEPADTPTRNSTSDGAEAPETDSAPDVTSPAPIKHVWLISLEGVDIAAAAASAGTGATATAAQASGGGAPGSAGGTPAFAELVRAGTVLSSYASVTKGSLANSIALISGLEPTAAQQQNCPVYSAVAPGKVSAKTGLVTGDGCVEPAQAVTIGDRLTGAGLVWRAYAEDIGAGAPDQTSCRHPDAGAADPFSAARPGDAYLTWRNPFVYFSSITTSADCGTAVVGLDRLGPELQTTSGAPALSYVIPDACHDGSPAPCVEAAPAGPDAALAWLGTTVPQILASPVYADGGLIVVTSADGPRPDPASTGGVPVGALLLSPYVAAGATVTSSYDHLSLLKTLSAIFGVPAPARAGDDKVKALDAKVFANAPAPGSD